MSPHGIMTASLAPRPRLRAAASVPGQQHPSRKAPATPGNQSAHQFAHQCDGLKLSVVDSGLWVDRATMMHQITVKPQPTKIFYDWRGGWGTRGSWGLRDTRGRLVEAASGRSCAVGGDQVVG